MTSRISAAKKAAPQKPLPKKAKAVKRPAAKKALKKAAPKKAGARRNLNSTFDVYCPDEKKWLKRGLSFQDASKYSDEHNEKTGHSSTYEGSQN